ncbi:MAG TPA: GTP pyrophosphokinase, partial [Candidatus Atribacteria bacterium]|nr:GTP pyrophosphokinase [Candidatus Atribacteria bacterium]
QAAASSVVKKPASQKDDAKSKTKGKKPDSLVRVQGLEDLDMHFAKCCNPVPGDPIIGYITRGRGVSVHRADCINLTDQAVEANRLVEVSWAAESKASYNAEIQIIARDRQAILADITNALAEIKINVTAINARTAKNKLAIINLVLEIHDTHQLEKVIKFFGRVKDVLDVFRVNA